MSHYYIVTIYGLCCHWTPEYAMFQCFASFNSHRVEIVPVTLDMQKSYSENEQWIDQCLSEAIIAFLLSF